MIVMKFIFLLLILPGFVSLQKQTYPASEIIEVMSIGKKNEFVRLEEISIDYECNIYITDAYKFTIKKYSPSGNLILEYGRRGNDLNDFEATPYKIICYKDTLAVVTKGSMHIKLFTTNFSLIKQISMPGVITDIIFNHKGQIIASIIPVDKYLNKKLILVDNSGKMISSVSLTNDKNKSSFDIIHLSKGNGNIIAAASRFRNQINIFTDQLEPINNFVISSLPAEAPYIDSLKEQIGKIPAGDIIKDIGVDTFNNIYILGGDLSKMPDQDVFVYDINGKFIKNFTLPNKTGIIYIDDRNFLYTRENDRTILKKYQLINFDKKRKKVGKSFK